MATPERKSQSKVKSKCIGKSDRMKEAANLTKNRLENNVDVATTKTATKHLLSTLYFYISNFIWKSLPLLFLWPGSCSTTCHDLISAFSTRSETAVQHVTRVLRAFIMVVKAQLITESLNKAPCLHLNNKTNSKLYNICVYLPNMLLNEATKPWQQLLLCMSQPDQTCSESM